MSKNEYEQRLIRIESRLVRGFEEMGICLELDPDWLTVNESELTVEVSTLGRSYAVLIKEMKARGAKSFGEAYTLIYRRESIGSIILR